MTARPMPDPTLAWPVPLPIVYEIATSESLALRAYKCPAGIWTIGWGETDNVRRGDTCTKEQADLWLLADLTVRVDAIRALCAVDPTDNQLGALLSLAYNIGVDALARSTVLRQHNAGSHTAAARAFALFNKARNARTKQLEVLDGLTARRAREAALYLTPDDGDAPGRMPQAVADESRLAASPIAQGGAVTVGTGALASVSAVTDQVRDTTGVLGAVRAQLQAVVDWVGIPPGLLLGLVLVGAGVAVMYWRARQRHDGWA